MAIVLLLLFAVASPAHATNLRTLHRKLFQATAVQAMRVHRFANIGTLCRQLTPEDAATIHDNARAMLDEPRSLLDPRDADWAAAYVAGLQDGALRSAALDDVVDAASCSRFATPGGGLDRILTWTGRSRSLNGILMSPRTMP